MTTLSLFEYTGEFAENKDVARKIRLESILPVLKKDEEVTLDFTGITGATQSFVHALISDLFRQFGVDVMDRISFKGCTETVRKVVTLVCDYMQEAES